MKDKLRTWKDLSLGFKIVFVILVFLIGWNAYLTHILGKAEDHSHYYDYAEEDHTHDYTTDFADKYHEHDYADSNHKHYGSHADIFHSHDEYADELHYH